MVVVGVGVGVVVVAAADAAAVVEMLQWQIAQTAPKSAAKTCVHVWIQNFALPVPLSPPLPFSFFLALNSLNMFSSIIFVFDFLLWFLLPVFHCLLFLPSQ